MFKVRPGQQVILGDHDPSDTKLITQKHVAKRFVEDEGKLFTLQEKLFAEKKRSLLMVLQAMDTGGKDGTITHVIGHLNPQGVRIATFKAPTPEERKHNFLWRIKKALPLPGEIGIFNRSHYEDVLVTRVKNLVPRNVIEKRYDEINRFEAELVKSGTAVVKFFLHISYVEQRDRLMERLDNPDKQWKFSANDVNERQYWDDYQGAFATAMTRCSTEAAPWYIIPANHKWFRNWAVLEILRETLQDMKPEYPHPRLNVPALKKRLAK